VHQAVLSAARGTLLDLGYHTSRDFQPETEFAIPYHLLPFNKEGAPPVEVHWMIVPPASRFPVAQDCLWQRSGPATVAGAQVRSLCPGRFRETLDWEQLRERPAEWRAARCLYLSLRLTVELLCAGERAAHTGTETVGSGT